MRDFLRSLGYVHREAWLFILACPLLAAIPMIVEFAQHIVELQTGMYVDEAGAKAAEAHPLRMAFGFAKVVAILIPMYWVTRFLHGGRDAAAARAFDRRAVWLTSGVLLVSVINSALSMFVFPATPAWLVSTMLAGFVVSALLARWQAAAPLGIFISPTDSARQMGRHLPWAITFSLVAMLPVMVLHYGLAIVAVVAAPNWLDWLLMAVDSVVVSWLAGILVAANYVVATRAGSLQADPNLPPYVGFPQPGLPIR